jgi:hypothetical protein
MRLQPKKLWKLTSQMQLQLECDSNHVWRIQLCFSRCCNFLQTYESFAYGNNWWMKLWSMAAQLQQPGTEQRLRSYYGTWNCTSLCLVMESRLPAWSKRPWSNLFIFYFLFLSLLRNDIFTVSIGVFHTGNDVHRFQERDSSIRAIPNTPLTQDSRAVWECYCYLDGAKRKSISRVL